MLQEQILKFDWQMLQEQILKFDWQKCCKSRSLKGRSLSLTDKNVARADP